MYYKATEDLLFKKILSEKGNEDVLEGFVTDVTNQHYTNFVVENPYTIETYRQFVTEEGEELFHSKVRTTIVDVSAMADNGTKVTIEMQLYPQQALEKRLLFYACNAYTESYPAENTPGVNPYRELKPVITICVLNFLIRKTALIHEVSYLTSEHEENTWRDQEGKSLLEIHEVSLKGTKLTEIDNPRLLEWQKFFQDGTITADSPEYLKKAKQIVDEANASGEEVMLMDWRKKREGDFYAITSDYYQQGVAVGLEEGIERGVQQGIAQERNATIRTLAESMSPEAIAVALKLPEQMVKKILEQN